MKKMLCIFLTILTIFISILPASTYASETDDTVTAEEFVSGIEKMMKESTEVPEYGKSDLFNENSDFKEFKTCKLIVKSSDKIDTQGAAYVVSGYNDLWILKFNSAEDTSNAYDYYSSCDEVEFVEADRPVYALSTVESIASTEKVYSSWGPEYIKLDELNSSIEANNIKLEEKIVAVLDTGTDSTHPAFNGRVIPTGVNTSTSGNRNDSSDDNGHGTQVAGVIIDSTLDNITVKPYKVLDNYGQGTLLTLAAGIICAVNDNVDVINMSISFAESSEVLKEAVKLADRNNILLVAAAGNDSSNTLYYPASYDGVIKVGAINQSGVIANFSTRGEDVDFAAPGVNIYTTNIGGKYKTVSGTSFSSPLVAALAATMLSFDPMLSTEDVLEILIENSISVQETDAKIKYGNGIINAPAYWDTSSHISKTESPYFSHQTAVSKVEIDLEIFCDTPNSVIYYTTDRTVPSKTNPSSIIYDGNPIHISQTAVITAVAYCEGRYRSSVVNFASIIVPVLSEEFFEIDAAGVITAYTGTKTSFSVPETINGITVTGVGEGVFSGMKISELFFPDTVTSIGKSAFEECTSLKTISAKGVTTIADRAFYNCAWLKNIYIENIISIGKYSFYNVCSQHYELTGMTFSLNLDKTTTISEGAFQYSAISNLNLTTAQIIGKTAFFECPALVSVQIDNLLNILNEAFKNCTSLNSVKIFGLSSVAVGTFSGCSSLTNVNIPDASIILSRAFENCTSLCEIILNSAEMLYSSAFTGCTSLRIINVPEMLSFESAIYNAGTTTYPKFSGALQAFIAPKLEETSAYMFSSAPNILAVSFKTLPVVADYTFSGCKNMMYLNIQSVTELSESALSGCEIDFIDARSLQTTEALPNNSGIMLSNNFKHSTTAASNLTVYGTSGSVAEEFANTNGYIFYPIPYIYEKLPKYITEISGTVTVRAVGFDLTYQWYSNSIDSNQGGTPIEGATSETYTFTEKDTSYYYYCVITQNDFGVITEYASDTIIKDPEPADYSFYNIAVKTAKELNPLNYTNFEIVDEALSVDVSGKRSCEQKIVDKQTAEIRSAIARLKYNKVTNATLSSSKKELIILQAVTVKVNTNPSHSVYRKIEWSSDNTDAFVVSKTGRVRCVGEGSAYIIARIINHDGSVVIARTKFKSSSASWLEEFFAIFVKYLYILVSGYDNSIKR